MKAIGLSILVLAGMIAGSVYGAKATASDDRARRGKVAAKPLFRDPVYDGAADPVVVWDRRARKWVMFYTNRRASAAGLAGVTWVHGTRIGIAESSDSGATWKYRGTAEINYGKEDYTHWAPDIVYQGGLYHMFLTIVPGTFTDWNATREIIHLTSRDIVKWKFESALKLASDKVIDPSVVQLTDGTWRMWYNNERDHKYIYYADSADLYSWHDRGKAVGERGEGPKVFRWKNLYWMVIDVWRGLVIYSSDDGMKWTRQPAGILEQPGRGRDDQVKGGHADVVVSDDRAFLFYFTHPGRLNPNSKEDGYEQRRSSIQVVELFYKDGALTCDRDAPTRILLRAPRDRKQDD
jgi:hypothetical protein